MGAARTTLDSLLERLSTSLHPAAVVLGDGGPGSPEASVDSDLVTVIPTALRRTGRSRRQGALLDLELSVRVVVAGPGALDLLEQTFVLAETSGMLVDTDPEPTGLGLTLILPVSVPIDEPTGPPVITTVVEVHPLSLIPGRVPVPADEAGVRAPDNHTPMPSPTEGS